jgi:hypothetical protein
MVSKAGGVNGATLLKWLDKIGWEKGIKLLEDEHRRTEEMAAYYWGDPYTYHQARKLQPKILAQAETLAMLYVMKSKNQSSQTINSAR